MHQSAPAAKRPYELALMVPVLIMLAATRMARLPSLQLETDEIWSIWQTFGTPIQIIKWTPYDWPPLFYLILGAWKSFTGIHPYAIRMLSIFIFLLGAAMLYRVTVKLFGQTAATLTVIGFGSFGYMTYISTLARGYVYLMALMPWALWLVLRYFHKPTFRRAIPLGLCMALMFSIHLSAVTGFVMLGVYTLIMYGKRIWWWWKPGVVAAVLASPVIINKLVWVPGHITGSAQRQFGPAVEWLGNFYIDLIGTATWIWIALMVIGAVILITRYRLSRQVLAFGLWLLAPIPFFYIGPIVDFYNGRYVSWIPMGFGIWIGWALSVLPGPRVVQRTVVGASAALLVVCAIWPVSDQYGPQHSGWLVSFRELAQEWQAGDVLIIDKNVNLPPETLDYYTQIYFPAGLEVVKDPTGHRRVWFLQEDGWQTPTLLDSIERQRLPRSFFGPWDSLFRLYEGPPNLTGVPYANGLRFHGMDVDNPTPKSLIVRKRGEKVKVRLWWSVDHPVTLDVSVGLYMLGLEGEVLATDDGAPRVLNAPRETSRWQPGQFYVDEREITIPENSTVITYGYPLLMAVYQPMDNLRVSVPGANSDTLLPIETIYVKAW